MKGLCTCLISMAFSRQNIKFFQFDFHLKKIFVGKNPGTNQNFKAHVL